MDRAKALLDKLSQHAYHRGDTSYFCRRTALEIIEECEQLELHLYGIDGFFLTPRSTEQPVEWILDMSENPTNYARARRFLDESSALPMFYEFVIVDPLYKS